METTSNLVKDWLYGFTDGARLAPVHEIEIKIVDQENERDLARAYRFSLQPEPAEGVRLAYMLDMDDTLLQSTPAKREFQQQVKELILTKGREIPLKEEELEILLNQANKGSRILASDGLHPEVYNPVLEMVCLLKLTALLGEEDYYWQEFNQLAGRGENQGLNEWVRRNIVLPAINDFLPAGLLETKEEGKTYFQMSRPDNCLATAENNQEVDSFSRKMVFEEEERELFSCFYSLFQESLFSPVINENLIPQANDPGRFVLVTFGEPRYQLIKAKSLISRLKEKGLRIPDEVIILEAGRKSPLLSHFFSQGKARVENYQQIQIDNSPRQVERMRAEGLKAVLFDPEEDKEKTLAELLV